jgi:hypothetical protein
MPTLTNDERQELEQLRVIVSEECPIGALDIVTTMKVERAYMMEQINFIKAENERLKRSAEIMANRIDHWTRIGG